MKRLLSLFVLGLAVLAKAASLDCPVTVRQNWPWDGKVILDVTMPEGTNDVAFTAEFLHDGERVSTELNIRTAIDGSPYCLTSGVHRLIWDPVAAGYAKRITEFQVKAEAVPANDRAWLVLEVASGKTEFVALGDEPRNAAGWPWQDAKYKNTHMVFRRIPAGVFTMGYTDAEKQFFLDHSPVTNKDGKTISYYIAKQFEVELTSDYYIAIYPTTGGQGHRIVDAASTLDNTGCWVGDGKTLGAGLPCFQRGSNSVEGINWPNTKFKVTPKSHVAKLRERCNNRFVFDIATAAQWQKAMRPDPQWLWYDTPNYGGGKITDSLETITNVLNVISQIPTMMKKTETEGKVQYGVPSSVGLHQPNSYGLYDSVGSRLEFVLDQFNYNLNDFAKVRVDPVGPTSNPAKRAMFGSWAADQTLGKWAMASFQACVGDQVVDSSQGRAYRYAIHLNPPKSFDGVWED